jgi:hypothetical protein
MNTDFRVNTALSPRRDVFLCYDIITRRNNNGCETELIDSVKLKTKSNALLEGIGTLIGCDSPDVRSFLSDKKLLFEFKVKSITKSAAIAGAIGIIALAPIVIAIASVKLLMLHLSPVLAACLGLCAFLYVSYVIFHGVKNMNQAILDEKAKLLKKALNTPLSREQCQKILNDFLRDLYALKQQVDCGIKDDLDGSHLHHFLITLQKRISESALSVSELLKKAHTLDELSFREETMMEHDWFRSTLYDVMFSSLREGGEEMHRNIRLFMNNTSLAFKQNLILILDSAVSTHKNNPI